MSNLAASKSSSRLSRKLCSKEARSLHGLTGSMVGTQVLIVSNTLIFRHLANTRVSDDDRVVDIGCAYGHCTALLRGTALGVDIAQDKVDEARQLYPQCRFACGDVLGEDLSWLDRDATVLFVDIGGGRNYKPVMKALAVCLPLMPALHLVVAKSIEVWNFLRRFEDSVHTVARDLFNQHDDDDAAAAEELAIEIRRRGGEVPLNLISLLRCGPRLRYLAGKDRLLNFLKEKDPLLRLTEVSYGLSERRLRVQAAPGEVPPPPPHALSEVRSEVAEKMRKQLRNGEEWFFLAVFGRLEKSLCKKLLAIASDPILHHQASDHSLDERCPEPWSDIWLSSVAMRHVHAFFLSMPEFLIFGSTAGEVPTITEFRNIRVRWTGETSEQAEAITNIMPKAADGLRLSLQVLDSNWHEGEEGTPEIQDLVVERAWLLTGEHVVDKLSNSTADVKTIK